MYIIYQATLPSGDVYIGRSGKTLKQRIRGHEKMAMEGSLYPLHVAMRNGVTVEWSVLSSTHSYRQSMAREIAEISKARKSGTVVLNLTRGGYFDAYDSGNKTNRHGVQMFKNGKYTEEGLEVIANRKARRQRKHPQ